MSKHEELMFDELSRMAYRDPDPQFKTGWMKHNIGLPVYELSDVASLFSGEWDDHAASLVPKRPPHDAMWVEWKIASQHDGWEANVQNGIAIRRGSIQRFQRWIVGAGCLNSEAVTSQSHAFDIMASDNHFFSGVQYVRVNKYTGDGPLKSCVGRLLESHAVPTIIFSADYTRSAFFYSDFGPRQYLTTDAIGGLSHGGKLDTFGSWVPAMCFALLNCKNVVTETVSAPPTPRKMLDRGCPPRVSYKVLKIEVPANRKLKTELTAEEMAENSGPKKRWHLVRGHFATMTHERFKNQGGTYWVPDHHRGDPALGAVIKDYKLKPRGDSGHAPA